MHTKSSLLESFLISFHDARPSCTSRAFGSLPVVFRDQQYLSSYEVLASTVPSTGERTSVLDLACGDGHLLAILAARKQPGLRLCGVDMSAGELQIARERLGAEVELTEAKAQHIPLQAGTLDYVLCHLALMLMDKADLVLHEVHRVLRRGATFACVVGATSPPTPAFTTYIETLARYPRRASVSGLRFGDRRLSSRDGILELFSSDFKDLSIDEILITRRMNPRDLWSWFLGMYALHLLETTDLLAIQNEYIAAASARCDRDGKLEYRQTLRYVSATAA